MTYRYRATWQQENLNEFALSHTVRYRDPLNKKRFAIPYKDAKKAQDKMAQLKRDGVKEIEITKDMLRGKFKEGVVNEDTDNERLATLRTRQMALQTKVREMDPGDPKTKTPKAIAQNDIENIQMRMDQIKDKMRRQQTNEMLEVIDESIKSDDDYRAKKKALQDIQNDPKQAAIVGKEKLIQRKDKLEKEYQAFKSKDKLAASKEFEKDLVAESPAAKEIDRTNTRRDSMDYQMYKKSAELLRKKDYKALGKHIHKSDTAPREYVMNVINKKEPATFKKIYGNQTGFLATMKPLNMGEADLTKGQIKKVHKMADELPKKDFKDRYGDEKGDAVRYATATNIIKKKEGIKEMQQIDEKIKGIQTKSDKSGIPYGILKQVYNRGMAAWKGGHRPGTTPQQWAFARVNSFITKGKSYYTADADLAKKARGAKKKKK